MKKPRKLDIKCGDSKCEANLHCFRPTRSIRHDIESVCRSCGVDLVDWERLRRRAIKDINHTFETLQHEFIRHEFWHIPLNDKVKTTALRKGARDLKDYA